MSEGIHPKLMTHRNSAPNTPRERAADPPEAEGATREDKVVQQLSTRQWEQSALAGPRENFYGGAPPAQPSAAALPPSSTPAAIADRPSGVVHRSTYQDPIRPRRDSSKNPYGHVRSVVAEYRRGTITDTEARHGIRGSPTEESLNTSRTHPSRRASLHPDQRPSRRPSSPRVPRCASQIPERYKYVPKPVKTEEELEEERRQKEEAEAAAAAAEAEKEKKAARKRSKSRRARKSSRRPATPRATADPKEELLSKYNVAEEPEQTPRPPADQLYPLRCSDAVVEAPPTDSPAVGVSAYRSKLVFDMTPPVLAK